MQTLRYCALTAAMGLLVLIDYPWGDLQNHPHWQNVRMVPFVSPPVGMIDITNNVILGMPIGIISALAFKRALGVAAVAALTASVAGEGIQMYSHSRIPSATDLATNVIGAIGACAATAAWHRRRNRRSL